MLHSSGKNAFSTKQAGAAILAQAKSLGFAAAEITSAEGGGAAASNLRAFLAKNYHGGMAFMARAPARRAEARLYWPPARSIILAAAEYTPARDPIAALTSRRNGLIAAYAQRRDYHSVFKEKLALLGEFVAQHYGGRTKVCVDDAPVMEKPLAAKAGLGWQGKNTHLVSRRAGCWLLLGACLSDLALPPSSQPEKDHCGSCRACLDVCPTKAFPAPYRIDARRCISYLTIEHKTHIPHAMRPLIGNRIFGCDDCLAVCPWNKFARAAKELNESKENLARESRYDLPPLADLAAFSRKDFIRFARGGALERLTYPRFLRNVLIAIGNSGDKTLLPAAAKHLSASHPLARAAAVWACRQLASKAQWAGWRTHYLPEEDDGDVRGEWAR